VIDTHDKVLEGLAVGGQGNAVFWLLLASVGLIAVLVGLKVIFKERRQGPRRDSEWRQR
jgi:hypothetical protein